jgi:hypothetical protein
MEQLDGMVGASLTVRTALVATDASRFSDCCARGPLPAITPMAIATNATEWNGRQRIHHFMGNL